MLTILCHHLRLGALFVFSQILCHIVGARWSCALHSPVSFTMIGTLEAKERNNWINRGRARYVHWKRL